MTWLLHLSDPHLGDVSPGQPLDDEKVVLSQRDLETTQTVFQRTLRKLGGFVNDHGKPSVVVLSGDLTYRARDDGFDWVRLTSMRGALRLDCVHQGR